MKLREDIWHSLRMQEVKAISGEQNFYSRDLNHNMELVKKGSYNLIPWIFCVFTQDSDEDKLRVAEFLNQILKTLSFDKIYQIDIIMREITRIEWDINWSELNINNFLIRQMSAEQKRAVLIFASFNTNGYIRQQAVEAMATYEMTLPFILLRCNDWVYQVRQSAFSLVVSNKLVNSSDKEIVSALPVMEKLRRSERCGYEDIFPVFKNAFNLNKNLIYKGLKSTDVKAKRFCISCIDDLTGIDEEDILTYIRHEKDPFLRKISFQKLSNSKIDIEKLSGYFLKDKFPSNRKMALQFLFEKKAKTVFDVAENLLLDRDAKVRALARNIISEDKRGVDIRQFYIDHMPGHAAVCLFGLGDVGTLKDCQLIETFLNDTHISVVRAAMTALMHLDPGKYIFQVTEMLSSEHMGIVKTSAVLLRKNKGFDFDRVYQIQEKSSSENTKIKCARLLFLASKWKALIYTLMLVGSEFEELEDLCQALINRWVMYYNRSFVMSTEDDRKKIKELIIEKRDYLEAETVKKLLFLSR